MKLKSDEEYTIWYLESYDTIMIFGMEKHTHAVVFNFSHYYYVILKMANHNWRENNTVN